MPICVKKTSAYVLGIMLGFAAVACTKAPSFDEYMQDARTFQAKRDYKSAIIQVKNALSTDPNHGEARFLLGALYQDAGDYSAAEIELRRAHQSDPESAPITAMLVRALLAQNQYDKAIDELGKFEKKHPELTPELLTLQGNARLGLGRKDAQASYLSALEKSPLFAEAQLALARLNSLEGKLDEALRKVGSILQQSPKNTDAWLFQGDLFHDKGVADEAEKSYRKVIEIDPANVQAHLHLADLYLRTNKLDALRAEINAVRALEPGNLMLVYEQAALQMKEKKYAAARETIQQLRKQMPDHLPSRFISGAAAYFTGSIQEADRDLTVYLNRFPKADQARKLLAANSLRANQPDKALETISPLLAPGNDAQAFAIAGEATLQLNQVAKAVEYLQKAAALAPQNAEVRTRLGVSRLATGQPDAGIADLESAFALAPESLRTSLILVLTHLNRKEYDKALAIITALQKGQPNNPSVLNLKALALLAQGNTAQARKTLETLLAVQPDYFPAANSLAVLDVRDNNFDAARKRYDAVLKKEPTKLAAMLALADVAAAAKNEKERVKWLEKASEAAPAAMRPWVNLTRYHLGNKDFRKAVTTARRAQSANPNNAEALTLLGLAQSAAGDKDDAVVTFQNLVKLTPDSPLTHYRLAMAQINARSPVAARASLDKALELRSDYADAEAALAALDVEAGNYADALKRAQRLRSHAPKSPAGAILEAELRTNQKDFAGASRAYEAALVLSKSSGLFIKAHQALVRSGKIQEADAKAAAWLKNEPADNVVRLYLATAAMETGKTQPAISQYQAVLEREPANFVALNNLAWLYQQTNDPRALPTAEQAAKLRPDDVTVTDTLGWILIQQGNTARGIDLLQRAATLAPKSGTLRYHLAVGYAKAGDKPKAREALDALLASNESFPERQEAMALRARL